VDIDQGNSQDVWLLDGRGTPARITFGAGSLRPIWSPDGNRVAYSGLREGKSGIFWKSADGSGEEQPLSISDSGTGSHITGDWSPDGEWIVFSIRDLNSNTGEDIWRLSTGREPHVTPYLQTQYNERSPAISPDGRWLGYISNESGRFEVYVQPFPAAGRKVLISTEGGTQPVWHPNGRELFYRTGDRLLSVPLLTNPTFSAGGPVVILEKSCWNAEEMLPCYDVSPDGTRFIMVRESPQVANVTQINVVLNWFEELRRRVPAAQ